MVHLDDFTKNMAIGLLDGMGVSLDTYINMALAQLVIQQRIPFSTFTVFPVPVSYEEPIETTGSVEPYEGLTDQFAIIFDVEVSSEQCDEARGGTAEVGKVPFRRHPGKRRRIRNLPRVEIILLPEV